MKHSSCRQKVNKMHGCNDYMGGIRPSNEDPAICSLAKCRATWIGFFTPDLQETETMVRAGVKVLKAKHVAFSTNLNFMLIYRLLCSKLSQVPWIAPTAPKEPVLPSMMLASHSTWPLSVKFEPRPAFVMGSSWSVRWALIRSRQLLLTINKQAENTSKPLALVRLN